MNISDVIGWKFNHQPGMRCAEDEDGVLQIVEFPGGIPTQEEQDIWVAEFAAYKNSTAITAEATRRIEEAYSPLKQRKLMSIATALLDKKLQGLMLTAEEEDALQTTRDVNAWITSVRDVENAAIANGTAVEDIIWPI